MVQKSDESRDRPLDESSIVHSGGNRECLFEVDLNFMKPAMYRENSGHSRNRFRTSTKSLNKIRQKVPSTDFKAFGCQNYK